MARSRLFTIPEGQNGVNAASALTSPSKSSRMTSPPLPKARSVGFSLLLAAGIAAVLLGNDRGIFEGIVVAGGGGGEKSRADKVSLSTGGRSVGGRNEGGEGSAWSGDSADANERERAGDGKDGEAPPADDGQKRPRLGKRKIRQISLLGERNSGTRWMYEHLGICFNHTVPVRRRLTRYKHWFQYNNPDKIPTDTLVIAQFRNPYEWILATKAKPHHAPEHIHLEWKDFVTKPWTMERVGSDLTMTNRTGRVCQEDFRYHELISCNYEPYPDGHFDGIKKRFSEHQPFYELRNDGSGEPYRNILEMRADKIRNFLNVRHYDGVYDVWTLQYEYLLKHGTESLVRRVEKETGVKANCTLYEPQERKGRLVEKSFVRYLNDHMDWEAEKLIGYAKQK